MGNYFSFGSLWNKLFGPREFRVLILGLDSAGKSTILYKLHCGEVVTTIPTIGFNMETVVYKNITFQVWDLGGQDAIRPYWRCYYQKTDAIIYVVDAADTDRIGTSRNELHLMLAEEELKNTALLVFANKQDLPGALSALEISEKLNLAEIKNRNWQIFKSSAINGTGLYEGLDWLVDTLSQS